VKSSTRSSFWKLYQVLPNNIKKAARKAFLLWQEHPFHPSLHFKCINRNQNVWSLRVSLEYRALCVLKKDIVAWFWIGNHKDYERFF